METNKILIRHIEIIDLFYSIYRRRRRYFVLFNAMLAMRDLVMQHGPVSTFVLDPPLVFPTTDCDKAVADEKNHGLPSPVRIEFNLTNGKNFVNLDWIP